MGKTEEKEMLQVKYEGLKIEFEVHENEYVELWTKFYHYRSSFWTYLRVIGNEVQLGYSNAQMLSAHITNEELDIIIAKLKEIKESIRTKDISKIIQLYEQVSAFFNELFEKRHSELESLVVSTADKLVELALHTEIENLTKVTEKCMAWYEIEESDEYIKNVRKLLDEARNEIKNNENAKKKLKDHVEDVLWSMWFG